MAIVGGWKRFSLNITDNRSEKNTFAARSKGYLIRLGGLGRQREREGEGKSFFAALRRYLRADIDRPASRKSNKQPAREATERATSSTRLAASFQFARREK